MSDVIIIERDFKGELERYALTYEEFCNVFSSNFSDGLLPPKPEGSTFTLQPLVHIWYKPCEVGSDEWNRFFTDMSWGLSEGDIESGNLAYIREDFMQSLKQYLPQNQVSLPTQAECLLNEFLAYPNGHELFYIATIINQFEQEEVPLNKEEMYAVTQRIIDLANVSAVPLLTAERVDAVCTLLNNGMRSTRSPEFPEASPEQMKEILLNCDIDIFEDIVEAVALDNQAFYGPDNEYFQDAFDLRSKTICLIESTIEKKPLLSEQITSASQKVMSSGIPFAKTHEAEK